VTAFLFSVNVLLTVFSFSFGLFKFTNHFVIKVRLIEEKKSLFPEETGILTNF